MTSTKEEVLNAAKYLLTFNQDEKYQEKLNILINYLSDITNSMLEYKKAVEESKKTMDIFAEKLNKVSKNMPKDHLRKQKK